MIRFITDNGFVLLKDGDNDMAYISASSDDVEYSKISTTKVSFTIKGLRYNNINATDIYFEGTQCTNADNFIELLKQTFTSISGVNDVDNFKFVSSLNDLPDAVNGVITLVTNKTYFFTKVVDLAGARLLASENTTILGASSENCRIKSTGLNANTALITSQYSLIIRNITIEHGTALDLDADGYSGAAIDWFGVNFTDCATIGTIANYSNVIWSDCAVLNSAGLTFDGSIGTVGFSQCIFDGRAVSTIIILPATLTITRRFRIIYSAFVVLSGETGINTSVSATIPVESYILDTVNFSGGGTYVTGVLHTDNKSLWENNKGISNSSEIAYYTIQDNVTATTITVNVPAKIAGTSVSQSITQKFSHSNNKATYTGGVTRSFKVSAILSLTSGNNHQVGIYVAKGGSILAESETYVTTSGAGRAENAKVQAVTELATNEFIEIWVENETSSTNITVEFMSVVIESLN
jgi:hypothetical protein